VRGTVRETLLPRKLAGCPAKLASVIMCMTIPPIMGNGVGIASVLRWEYSDVVPKVMLLRETT
jgi:hypothetical protein